MPWRSGERGGEGGVDRIYRINRIWGPRPVCNCPTRPAFLVPPDQSLAAITIINRIGNGVGAVGREDRRPSSWQGTQTPAARRAPTSGGGPRPPRCAGTAARCRKEASVSPLPDRAHSFFAFALHPSERPVPGVSRHDTLFALFPSEILA